MLGKYTKEHEKGAPQEGARSMECANLRGCGLDQYLLSGMSTQYDYDDVQDYENN